MWKNEFVKYMFPPNRNLIHLQRAKAIKQANIPQYLYKYRTINSNSLSNLRDTTLWLSNPFNLNDPIDCIATFDVEKILPAALSFQNESFVKKYNLDPFFTDDEIQTVAKNGNFFDDIIDLAIHKKLPGWQEFLLKPIKPIIKPILKKLFRELIENAAENFRSSVKIISFTEKYDNSLMWAHYANGHKGFCIEFDFSRPLNQMQISHLYPVLYQEGVLDITPFLSQIENINIYFPIYSAIVKRIEWEYEKEWRIVIPFGIYEKEENIAMPPISRIFIGAKCLKHEKDELLSIAAKKRIPVVQMEIDSLDGTLITNAR
ncbi:DUF2971 domain-containing protein [Leptospira sp. GIMC2001]|uniref:DUF2971 domain-containing protein n=1 Tax=Leptospira sp. GIMC2001 TaxID=1513297 RepID=UPI00234ACB80|nr:DUF2971 domain-containing protein [Leptospira sp. GIMC2001]WCL51469.1 DUF2971 domain-containing protein [Leptospira sp. GIMC2001]